ncbi:MAG TPA: hypothetical protein VLJ83_03195 [Gemmatimonadaceae bacterium]|nr:hypothetical protein [Gemmatimonadaceae bacterium]
MRLAIVIGLLAAIPQLSAAQFPAEVQAGARVRVWLPESARQENGPERRQLLRGTVQSVDMSMLNLSVPGAIGAVAIPRSAVRRLDVSRGVSRPASMIERAIGGAIGGAVTMALLNDPHRSSGPRYRTDWRAAGVGAAWGGGAGALIGLLFPYEQWRRVIH